MKDLNVNIGIIIIQLWIKYQLNSIIDTIIMIECNQFKF